MANRLDEYGNPIQEIGDKVLPENETRRKILNRCRQLGCYDQMVQIFSKYDRLLKSCTNEKEREDISKLGIYEAYQLMDRGGKLYVKNDLIYVDKDDPHHNEDIKIIT